MWLVRAIALLILLPMSVASAQELSRKQQAKQHFNTAARHYEAAKQKAGPAKTALLHAAVQEFKKAYRLYPRAQFLSNMGWILAKLGRDVEAANAFARYLADPNAETVKVQRIRPALAKLDLMLGIIVLNVKGDGVDVHLDGAKLGAPPLRVVRRVTPGSHEAVARWSPGVATDAMSRRKVTLAKGQRATITLEKPNPPPVKTVVERALPRTTRPTHATRRRQPSRVWMWTGAGALGAAFLTTYAGLRVRSIDADIDALNATSMGRSFAEAESLQGRADKFAFATNLGLATTGALLVTTALLLYRNKRTESAVTVTPTVSGAMIGVHLPW